MRFVLRLFLFWLCFFAAFRCWFVLWFRNDWSPDHPASVGYAFLHAFPLDASMAGYLTTLPVLAVYIGIALGPKAQPRMRQWLFYWNAVLIWVAVGLFGANVFIYEEWHTLLNDRALQYMSSPSALFDSLSWTFTIAVAALYIGASAAFVWIYRRWVHTTLFSQNSSRIALAGALPVLALLFTAIRGGWGVMPVNESAVYYSDHLFDNHAATNPGWRLAHSLLEVRATRNHYQAFSAETAENYRSLLFPDVVAQSVPTTTDTLPNLVIIVMESMTAQVISALGGEAGVCPNIDQLANEGLLFTQCYSSGYRTDQGIVSVLGGYPAQPDQSVVLHTEKAARLNSLPKWLKERHGYATAFFYGGALTFANMGVWLAHQRFDKIISENDFKRSDLRQRWGADDHTLLQRALQEINTLQQPFLAVPLTLSLHPPYDVPFESNWKGPKERDLFLHSAAFADYAVGAFMENARRQPWFERTLFVLVADHGSANPAGVGLDQPLTRRIPLVVFGPQLPQHLKGRRMEVFGNHHDIPATLLALLGKKDRIKENFPWSRNLLEWNADSSLTRHSYAYYTNEDGLGWATPQGAGFYRFHDKAWQWFGDTLPPAQQGAARSYLQWLYDDYLAL